MKRVNSYKEFQKELESHASDKAREIAETAIPCERPFTGIKIPALRKIIGTVAPECYREFLDTEPVTVAEVLARGMIVCRLPYEEMLKWFDSQIKYIDNWCTCDTFCGDLKKCVKPHKDEFFSVKVKPLLLSDEEFATRVGLVIMKCLYVEPEFLNIIFHYTEQLRDREEYYVRMGIAWLLSECFIKYPSATIGYLAESELPKWTLGKTVSKICDSYRVDDNTKYILKRLRKEKNKKPVE